MIKKILAILLCFVIVLSCVACSNDQHQETNKPTNNTDPSGQPTDPSTESTSPTDDTDGTVDPTQSSETENEPDKEPLAEFEKADIWDEATPSDRFVQIGDVVYVPGIKVSDFIALVESSSIDYQYEYNPDKLAVSSDIEILRFTRDGEEWFEIYTVNVEKEARKLADNVVCRIVILNARPYVRVLDGRLFDEFIGLEYAELKNIFENDLGDFFGDRKEFDWQAGGEECIKVTYVLSNSYLPNVPDWTDYDMADTQTYMFCISKDTGKVIVAGVTYGDINSIVWYNQIIQAPVES